MRNFFINHTQIFKLLVVVLVVSLMAVGCSGGQTKKQNAEILIWQPFASKQAITPIIQEFQKLNKGVRVTVVDKDINSYTEELLEALATGKGPDIFAVNNAWTFDYLDKIAPAPTTIVNPVDIQNEFVDSVFKDFVFGDRVYGTAFSVDTLALYYNKSLLADAGVFTPPTTWEELQTASRKISRQDQNGYFSRSGIAFGHSSLASGGSVNRAEDILYLLSMQLGGSGFRSDGSAPIFGNSVQRNGRSIVPMAEAMRFYTSFADGQNPNYTWNAQSDYSIDAFASGRVAMMLGYSYAKDLIRQKKAGLDFGIAPTPQLSLDAPAVHFANYWGQVVSRQSKNSDLAWAFLRFATSKTQLEKYLAETKLPSSRKDLLDGQSADLDLFVFAKSAPSAKSFFRPQALTVDKIFAGAIDSVVFSGASPRDAVSSALRQTQGILQKKN